MRKYIPKDVDEMPGCDKTFNAIWKETPTSKGILIKNLYCTRPKGHKGKCSWGGLKKKED